MGGGGGEGGVSSLLSSFFFLSSVVLFIRSLSLLSLSATMTLITRPVGSLCVHTALTCLSVRVPVLWLIPCLANMFVSCKKQLSWYDSASLVPHGMKWACICAGNGCCVWWCLVVLVCGNMWKYVLVCVSMCYRRCVVGCVSVSVDALAVVWW